MVGNRNLADVLKKAMKKQCRRDGTSLVLWGHFSLISISSKPLKVRRRSGGIWHESGLERHTWRGTHETEIGDLNPLVKICFCVVLWGTMCLFEFAIETWRKMGCRGMILEIWNKNCVFAETDWNFVCGFEHGVIEIEMFAWKHLALSNKKNMTKRNNSQKLSWTENLRAHLLVSRKSYYYYLRMLDKKTKKNDVWWEIIK